MGQLNSHLGAQEADGIVGGSRVGAQMCRGDGNKLIEQACM